MIEVIQMLLQCVRWQSCMYARQTACTNDTGCGTSLVPSKAWEQGLCVAKPFVCNKRFCTKL